MYSIATDPRFLRTWHRSDPPILSTFRPSTRVPRARGGSVGRHKTTASVKLLSFAGQAVDDQLLSPSSPHYSVAHTPRSFPYAYTGQSSCGNSPAVAAASTNSTRHSAASRKSSTPNTPSPHPACTRTATLYTTSGSRPRARGQGPGGWGEQGAAL